MGGFVFSPEASSSIINNPNHTFLAQEFVLKPGGVTTKDRAPKNRGKYEKNDLCCYGQIRLQYQW
jgi:hypothetical protein